MLKKYEVFKWALNRKNEDEILIITAETRDSAKGFYCLQQAVCQNCGITLRGKYLLFSRRVARREVCGSRNFGKLPER